MRDELCQSFALLPRSSEPWIWVAKPSESRVKKFICGRSLPTAALSVEGPTINKLGRTIMVTSHPQEPMIDECGLPRPSPCNDLNEVYILVCPCIVQETDVLFATKNITSCDGHSGDRN